VCDATNAVRALIGTAFGDFSQPLVWSQPFYVTPSATTTTTMPSNGLTGTPSYQIAILLQPGSGGGTALPTSPIPTITDQTTVEVRVPANAILQPGQSANIYECSDADGTFDNLPTDGSTCDGLTSDTGATINVSADGSIDKRGYEIFSSPQCAALNEESKR